MDDDKIKQTEQQVLGQLIERKPRTAQSAALGATIGAVLGAIVFGPPGAAIGGALGGGLGGYYGAKDDEAAEASDGG
jgi:hypothetical protein